jgi:hypothetical protein
MRPAPAPDVEGYRVRRGDMATPPGERFGKFITPAPFEPGRLVIVATDGIVGLPEVWEHVSVSAYDLRWRPRMPTWDEMCWVKEQFWDEEEWVLQFHPARSVYVNNASNVLHLWKLDGFDMPTPDPMLVGIPGIGPIT